MVVVYVWTFRGASVAWGHASLLVQGADEETYISWWPQARGRAPKISGAPGILRNLYSVSAIQGRTYDDDVRDERQLPDHVVRINGLNEVAIKNWWIELINGADTTWSTLGQNCSTTVARALKAGGGDDKTTGFGGWWDSWNTVWTPNDLLAYALAIQRGING